MDESTPMATPAVYENTVDGGSYFVRVTRLGGYIGRLVVTVIDGGEVLLDKPVGLRYGAPLGPDVDDVAQWQDEAIVAIDAWIERSHDGTD